MQNWGIWGISSASNLTFWHIILSPQTTMLFTTYNKIKIKKGSKKKKVGRILLNTKVTVDWLPKVTGV